MSCKPHEILASVARAVCVTLVCILLPSCFLRAPDYTLVTHSYQRPRLGEKSFTSYDSQSFPYRKFLSSRTNAPALRTVVIGIHGFCGASIDYENLGHWLMQHQPEIGLYAYDVRGQGFDPLVERRGDIDNPQHWYRDLTTFTELVRRRHPSANIVWQGESMGALILSHCYRHELAEARTPPCDAIIITSPVVTTKNGLAPWKKEGVRLMARAFPYQRVSIDALSGGEKISMTSTSTHQDQSDINSWNIERHTLRLLSNLGTLIDQMPECAQSFQVPTLIVHGGKDFFATPQQVHWFYQQIPTSVRKKRLFYPSSHHLLMYDTQKQQVLADITQWLTQLPASPQLEVGAYK